MLKKLIALMLVCLLSSTVEVFAQSGPLYPTTLPATTGYLCDDDDSGHADPAMDDEDTTSDGTIVTGSIPAIVTVNHEDLNDDPNTPEDENGNGLYVLDTSEPNYPVYRGPNGHVLRVYWIEYVNPLLSHYTFTITTGNLFPVVKKSGRL